MSKERNDVFWKNWKGNTLGEGGRYPLPELYKIIKKLEENGNIVMGIAVEKKGVEIYTRYPDKPNPPDSDTSL